MKGLELAESYYKTYIGTFLEDFSDIKDKLAFGLVGSGSEAYGFDDDISKDHDFEPGFCIFVPSYLDRKTLFSLERAYAKLPKEHLGYKRSILENGRHGVILIDDFYKSKIGSLDYESVGLDWFKIDEHFLSEATNGKIFNDYYNVFSSIREKIKYYPEDIYLKKLASALISMKQAGNYNYIRCLKHKDKASSQLALFEYVKYALSTIFILNRVYKPYYKWQFRYLKDLKILNDLESDLEFLISNNNEEANIDIKLNKISRINEEIINEIKKQRLSNELCDDLENNAFSINNKIKDPNIRNLDILYAN